MEFIKSQNIPYSLTHILHKREHFDDAQKEGVKVHYHDHSLLWKPEAFWISMDNDWERWCTHEDFADVENGTICDVILKPDTKFMVITNVDQAEELGKLLMPNFEIPARYSYHKKYSDMLTLSMYMTEKIKEGIVVGDEIWNPIRDVCDGIYFLNSGTMHFETFFNTWDAHSIALFDGKNCSLDNPRSGKDIANMIKSEDDD